MGKLFAGTLGDRFSIKHDTAYWASVADGWLIAYAKVNGLVLATHETYEPNVKNRVKIPNVCLEFDVDYVDTLDMLVDLKAKFTLTPRGGRKR